MMPRTRLRLQSEHKILGHVAQRQALWLHRSAGLGQAMHVSPFPGCAHVCHRLRAARAEIAAWLTPRPKSAEGQKATKLTAEALGMVSQQRAKRVASEVRTRKARLVDRCGMVTARTWM